MDEKNETGPAVEPKQEQQCKQARPHDELIAELLDSRQPKTEREHAAVREIERLRAEFAEAKKFKDGMLDVLGGACPNDHRSTPFEEFKGCTPCLRAERAELLAAIEAMRVAGGAAEFQRAFDEAKIIAARKGEGE